MANTTEITKLETASASPQQAAVKLRRILVSVYLETSAAIDYALELAKIPGTHFVLLHVIETPRSERNLGAFVSKTAADAGRLFGLHRSNITRSLARYRLKSSRKPARPPAPSRQKGRPLA
jgi:hypothetical protein